MALFRRLQDAVEQLPSVVSVTKLNLNISSDDGTLGIWYSRKYCRSLVPYLVGYILYTGLRIVSCARKWKDKSELFRCETSAAVSLSPCTSVLRNCCIHSVVLFLFHWRSDMYFGSSIFLLCLRAWFFEQVVGVTRSCLPILERQTNVSFYHQGTSTVISYLALIRISLNFRELVACCSGLCDTRLFRIVLSLFVRKLNLQAPITFYFCSRCKLTRRGFHVGRGPCASSSEA